MAAASKEIRSDTDVKANSEAVKHANVKNTRTIVNLGRQTGGGLAGWLAGWLASWRGKNVEGNGKKNKERQNDNQWEKYSECVRRKL